MAVGLQRQGEPAALRRQEKKLVFRFALESGRRIVCAVACEFKRFAISVAVAGTSTGEGRCHPMVHGVVAPAALPTPLLVAPVVALGAPSVSLSSHALNFWLSLRPAWAVLAARKLLSRRVQQARWHGCGVTGK